MLKKLLLLSFFTLNSLFAYIYNDLLIKTQATIFPKIILLDQNLVHKLKNNTIVLAIIYEKDDLYTAQTIKKIIENNYKHLLDGYYLHIKLIEITQLQHQTKNDKVTAFYVLNLSEESIAKISNIASKQNIITFSYDLNNLQKGLLFSVTMEQSPTFYINKKNLYAENVDFVLPLLQMVKFVDKEYNK